MDCQKAASRNVGVRKGLDDVLLELFLVVKATLERQMHTILVNLLSSIPQSISCFNFATFKLFS